MKLTRKISIALVLVMLLTLTLAVIPASAASQPETLYLTPSANWKQSNARFAAYFFGNGETWVSMTDSNGDGVYEVKVPTAKVYPNVIFCRMNPGTTANNWNNKWNQTADLVIPTSGTNHYTVKEGTWDKGGGTWSTFGSTCQHANLGDEATCTTPQVCLDCKDPVVSALGHNFDTAHKCGRCGVQATFTVAGSGAHLGTEWDTGNTANDMTYADGVYTKVYENVAAGSYLLKVARDHDWGTAYPSADKPYTVAEAGSTVTVTLKGETVSVVVTGPAHVCDYTIPATCLKGQSCECGLVKEGSEPTDHTFENGLCTVCGTLDLDNTVTVYFENNWNWTNINLYYWYGSDNTPNAAWPGVALGAPVAKSEFGSDVYAIEIPVGVTAFIINGTKADNSGSDQTPDIKEFSNCISYYMEWENDANTVKTYERHSYTNGCDADCNTCGATRTPNHEYFNPCDKVCMNCFEETNPDATHTIVHVDAVEATDCQTMGNVEYWYCSDCGSAWLDEAQMLFTNLMSVKTGYGEHKYTYPCDAHCMLCGELTNEEAVHTIVHVDAVEATCQKTGNVEHWYCSDCGSAWLDEALTMVTNRRSVVTFKDHEYLYSCDAHCMLCGELTNEEASHTIVHVDAVEATCQKTGNVEYWCCSICGSAWLDEALTMVTNRRSVVTFGDHEYFYECDAHCMVCGELTNEEAAHSIKHVEAVAATCFKTGNIEYWTCEHCGACWDNENATGMPLNAMMVKTYLDHEYIDAICVHCGSQDPTTKAPDYIFTTDSLDPIEQGDVKKGDTLKVGTDDYFTIIFGDKSKVDASKATFEDGFVAAQRLHFNGNTKVESKNVSRSIMFTTEGPTTIKIWWKAGKDGRNMEIYTFDGSAITAVYSSSTDTTEGSLYITTFEITKAGTYYLGHAGGTNYIYKVTLTKHDHEHNYQPKVVAPTCEDAGYTVNVCSTCGFVGEKTNEVEALGHDMITDAAKAPTCTETGLTEGSHCSRCDKKVAQETVDALGHDMVTDEAKAPTCTEIGLTEGSHCSRCDEKVAQEEIPALGHTYFYNACLVCGGANPNFIANYLLAGNNKVIVNEYHLVGDGQNGNHTFPYEFVLLTVLEDGKYAITSDKLVGVTIYTTEVNSEGADFTAGTGSSWAKYVFGEAELKAGTYFVGLVYMNGVGEYDVAVTKHVHSFADATCTAPKTCACGATEGTALGHDMVTDAAKAPTCTEIGLTEGSHCSRCDHKVAQEEIPATGHTFEEGKCACGAEDPNYTPDQPADDEPEQELNIFQKIWKMITDFFGKIVGFFKNIFVKK